MEMKLPLSCLIGLAALLLTGCCSSRCGSPPATADASQRTEYDSERDVTTIEKGGYTWQLKGKVSGATAVPESPR